MQKSGCILVNPYACLDELFIIGLRQQEDDFLIGNSRCHDPHIHPSFRSQTKCCHHLIINDQIRGTDINIILCLIDNIQINILSYGFVIQRGISIGLYKTVILKFFHMIYIRTVRRNMRSCPCNHTPHLQKHNGKIPDAFSMKTNPGIFPMSETDILINVFICQIDSSRISCMAINHQYFSVIPVIQDNIQDRTDRIKCRTFNSFCLQLFVIAIRKRRHTSHIIIDQTDIHAFFCFFFQNLQNLIPHFAFMNDEIFKENKMSGLFQILQHICKHRFPYRIIFCGSVILKGKSRIVANISRLIGYTRICLLQFLSHSMAFFEIILDLMQHC